MFLCLPVLYAIFCGYDVTSRFVTQFCYSCWVPCFLVASWYMTLWSKHRSCVGRCWFLWFTLISSLCRPICHFAAFDIGKVDLVALIERICIGDCKWLDKGVFLYVIRHLCRSCSSSFALWNRFLTIWTYFLAIPFDWG